MLWLQTQMLPFLWTANSQVLTSVPALLQDVAAFVLACSDRISSNAIARAKQYVSLFGYWQAVCLHVCLSVWSHVCLSVCAFEWQLCAVLTTLANTAHCPFLDSGIS